MTKLATFRVSGVPGTSFFRLEKVKIVHRGFAALCGWADVSALPKMSFTQLKAPSPFPTENLLELFRFIQSLFRDEKASMRRERGLLGSLSSMPVLLQWASAALMVAGLVKRQKQFCFRDFWRKTVPAHGLRRENRCLLLELGALQCCTVWMAHTSTDPGWHVPGVAFFLLEIILRHNEDLMTLNLSLLNVVPVFFLWMQLMKDKPLFLVSRFSFVFFYSAAQKLTLVQTLQMPGIPIPTFLALVGYGHLQHAEAGWEGSPCSRDHVYFTPAYEWLKTDKSFAFGAFFSFNPVHPIEVKMMMMFL